MKGRRVLVIPGRLSDRHASIGMKRAPKEHNQAVEAEERRRRAVNGKVGPLTLRFDPQVGPALLKRRFQAPAFHESAHDQLGGLRLVGGEQRLWRSPSLGIAGKNPADRHRLTASAIPQGGPRAHLQRAFSLPIPIQGEMLPLRVRIGQDRFKGGQASWMTESRRKGVMRVTCCF